MKSDIETQDNFTKKSFSWPLWFLLFSPKFGLFLKSWHFTERSKTASVTLNLQWNAKTISPLKLFFLHLKTCFSELENKTYFWKKWKWSAEFDFWRVERMLKSKWVHVDQNDFSMLEWCDNRIKHLNHICISSVFNQQETWGVNELSKYRLVTSLWNNSRADCNWRQQWVYTEAIRDCNDLVNFIRDIN